MIQWLLILAAGAASVVLAFSAMTGWRNRRWFRRRRAAQTSPEPADDATPDDPESLRFPLSGCPLGQSVCLQCLEVDHCVLHRLRELGLTPGVELAVIQDSGGPLLVSVRGSRVALGRDLANNLYVIPSSLAPNQTTGSDEEAPPHERVRSGSRDE